MHKSIWKHELRFVLTLFVILTCIYMSNMDIFQHDDATANIYLASNMIQNHSLYFSKEDYPFMFTRRDNGEIAPHYYLTQVQGSSEQAVYINRFGIGTGLVLVPVFLVLDVAAPGTLENHYALWISAKTVAAALTAGSAVLVYLIALVHVRSRQALLICLVYALATSAWSYASQTMFQHTACNFFLLLGIYLLYVPDTRNWKGLAGSVAMAYAAWCRPTCLVFILFSAVFIYLHRKNHFRMFFTINLISILGMAAYNYTCTGLPWSFPQIHDTDDIVIKKTGQTEIWQTSILTGLAGILFSPARGLFFYSPFFVYSIYGAARLYGNPGYRWICYLGLAALVVLLIDASWFDWWGGWCYGYRLILETVPVFCLLLIPVIDRITAHARHRAIFIGLMVWSVAVQFVGAFAYDIDGWNLKVTYEIRDRSDNRSYFVSKYDTGDFYVDPDNISDFRIHTFNIDSPAHRHRLWSLADNPVSFYIMNFLKARETKIRQAHDYLEAISQAREVPSSRGLNKAASK